MNKSVIPEVTVLTVNGAVLMADIQTYISFVMVVLTALITIKRQYSILIGKIEEKKERLKKEIESEKKEELN